MRNYIEQFKGNFALDNLIRVAAFGGIVAPFSAYLSYKYYMEYKFLNDVRKDMIDQHKIYGGSTSVKFALKTY